MKVKDIMSKNIASVCSDDCVQKAAQIMREKDIGSVPVCSNGKIEGIVTDRDLAIHTIAEGKDCKQQKVSEIMSPSPATGCPEMDVNDAARIMSQKRIRRLPIIENDSIVGVVSLCDISTEPMLEDNAGEALKNISQPGHARA